MPRTPPPSHVPQPRLTPPDATPALPAGRTTQASRATWTTLSRELAVTFLGVLLALAVNGWWHGRQDRVRERVELEQILATTRENELRLVQAIRHDSLTQAVAQQTAERLASVGPAPSLDSLLSWLPRSFRHPEWHPLKGTYAALIQTGELRLIRNVRLRGQIATYVDEMETTSGTFDRMAPLALRGMAEMYRLVPTERMESLRRANASSSAEGQRLVAALRRNVEVRQLLRSEHSVAGNRVALLKALHSETTGLRQALESALHVTAVATQASDQFKI